MGTYVILNCTSPNTPSQDQKGLVPSYICFNGLPVEDFEIGGGGVLETG